MSCTFNDLEPWMDNFPALNSSRRRAASSRVSVTLRIVHFVLPNMRNQARHPQLVQHVEVHRHRILRSTYSGDNGLPTVDLPAKCIRTASTTPTAMVAST